MNSTDGTKVLVRSRKGRMVARGLRGTRRILRLGRDPGPGTRLRHVRYHRGHGCPGNLAAWGIVPGEGEKTSIAGDLISKNQRTHQADGTMTGFRPFFNPATGEWIEFTAVAEDSDEDLLRFSWRSVPGGLITEHIHPHQEERFIITSGQARFTLNGQQLVARAGETIVVPPGVRHSEGNPGPAEIRAVVELRPALRTRQFHEAVAGLAADGRTTPRGAPRNPLQLGATFWHFRHESRVTSPPIGVQNLMLPPLWVLARAFGLRPYYARWDSRIHQASRPRLEDTQ
jgi:quercetin dioxygenase-like cupin family protein